MSDLNGSDKDAFDRDVMILRTRLKFGHDTDFTIKLGIFTWRVHTALLSKLSGFFERLINGPFMESEKRSVVLHDDDPWIFARFLQYVYTNEWNRFPSELAFFMKLFPTLREIMIIGAQGADLEESMLMENRRTWVKRIGALYQLADKYDVPCMKSRIAKVEVSYLHAEHIQIFTATVGEDLLSREASLKTPLSRQSAKFYVHNKLDVDELLKMDKELTSMVIQEAI